jgi:putative transposase
MSVTRTALAPGRYYHIYSHAVGNANLFLATDDFRHFLARLATHTPRAMQVLCYCLLGNHFHLLTHVHDAPVIKPHLALSHTLNGYTQYFNQ